MDIKDLDVHLEYYSEYEINRLICNMKYPDETESRFLAHKKF